MTTDECCLLLLPPCPTPHTGQPATNGGGSTPHPPAHKKWGKSRPFYAQVAASEGLCSVSSAADKNTLCVKLDLAGSGLTYLPGDALGIYPTNNPNVSNSTAG